MMRKGPFFDLFARHGGHAFDAFIAARQENRDYISFRNVMIPNSYDDPAEEYTALRDNCAMFDISANTKFAVTGANAGRYLDFILSRPVSKVAAGRVVYALMCDEDGYIRDDVIVYKLAEDEYLLMPALEDGAYLAAVCARFGATDVAIEDRSDRLAGIALQGPASTAVLAAIGCEGIETLVSFGSASFLAGGLPLLVGRMGFTGDLGYEIWFSPDLADAVGTALVEAGERLGLTMPGYGLAVVEATRIEAGLIVPGRDFATRRTPRPGLERFPGELGLDWLVRQDGRRFIGAEALAAAAGRGPRFALRSFTIDGATRPRHGDPILAEGGETTIGIVTSAAWSWGLGCVAGHASVAIQHAGTAAAEVRVDGGRVPVRLSTGPLVRLPRRAATPPPPFTPHHDLAPTIRETFR